MLLTPARLVVHRGVTAAAGGRQVEKRGRQRRKTRLPVRFGAARPDKMGLITDVSTGGVYISTNAVLPPGTAVCVQVPVAGGEPLQLDGRVIRTRRVPPSFVMISTGGMGVRLRNVPPSWRASQALPEDA
ncbi:MAG: PilZ domain-containing protein [Vicinamibacterales bacterium]